MTCKKKSNRGNVSVQSSLLKMHSMSNYKKIFLHLSVMDLATVILNDGSLLGLMEPYMLIYPYLTILKNYCR